MSTVHNTLASATEEVARLRRADNDAQKNLIRQTENTILQRLESFEKIQNEREEEAHHLQSDLLEKIDTRFQQEFDAHAKNISALSDTLTTIQASCNSYSSEVGELRRVVDSSNKSIQQQITTNISDLRELFHQFQGSSVSHRKGVLDRLDTLELNISQILDRSNTLQTQFDVNAASARTQAKTISSLEERISKMEQSFQNQQILSQQKEEKMQATINNLTTSLKAVEARITTQSSAVAQQAQGLEDCESGLEKVKLRLKEETRKRVAELE